MAKIQNVVETRFTTRGGAKTAKETEAIGRAQTRLGQASASSGRAFAAQASGLGGVVSAYAGAAATIFALSAAFNALNRAAQNQQAIDGTRTLAATVGEQGDLVLSKIQEITKGQLSIAEAAKTTNLALSAGFNSEQIENLTKVALKASVALGRNLVDSQDRLVRGVAKIEPEILDELGIIVRLDDAVKKYADSIGKAASDLTTYERSQAFANATIDQGLKKFSIIDTTVTTSAEALNKFSADLQNLSDSLLGILAQALGPFVSFLSGNFANTLAAAGILGGLIFSKLSQVVAGGLGSATIAVQNFGASIATNFEKSTAKASKSSMLLSKTLEKLNLQTVKGTRDTQTKVRELVKLGRQGTLTAVELRSLIKALQQQAAAGVNVEKALRRAELAYGSLGKGAQFAAAATAVATKIISGTTKAVNLLVGALGKIFFFVSIFQLLASTIGKAVFGIDLFAAAGETIKSFFEDYTKKANAAARAQAAFNDFLLKATPAANQAQQALNNLAASQVTDKGGQFARFLGLSGNQVEGKEAIDAARKISSRIREAIQEESGSLKLSKSGSVISAVQRVLKPLGLDSYTINQVLKQVKTSYGALGDLTKEEAKKLILEVSQEVAAQDLATRFGLDPTQATAIREGIIGILSGTETELANQVEKLYKILEDAVPGLASRFNKITEAVKDQRGATTGMAIQGEGQGLLQSAFGGTKGIQGEQFNIGALQQTPELALFLTQLAEFQKLLAESAFTSEGLSKKQDALRKSFAATVKELEKTGPAGLVLRGTLDSLFRGPDSIINNASKAGTRLAELGDALKEIFGKEIKAAADLYKVIRIAAGDTVKVNQDSLDIEKSRLNFLQRGKDLINAGRKLTEKEQEIVNRTTSILKGIYTSINIELEKQNKALDKATKKAQLQLTIETNKLEKIKLQGQIDQRNRQIAADKDKLSQATAEAQAQITNGLKVQLDFEEATLALAQQGVDAKIAAAEETLRQNTLLREQQKISAQIAAEDARRTNQMQSTVASTFGGLFTDRDRQAIEMDALRIDASEALKLAEIQRRQTAEEIDLANKKYTQQLALLNTEKGIIEKRFQIEERKLQNERAENLVRTQLLEAEKGSVGANAKDQIEQARLDRASRNAQISATLNSQRVQKELVDKQLDVMLEQARALKEHQVQLGDALFQHAVKITEAMGGTVKFTRQEFGKQDMGGIKSLEKQVLAAQAANEKLFDTQVRVANTQLQIAKEEENNKVAAIKGARDKRVAAIDSELRILEGQKKSFADRAAILDMQKQKELADIEEKIKAAERERDTTISTSQAALKAAEDEASAKQKAITAQEKLNEILNNSFLKVVNSISEKIQDRLGAAVEDFFGALREGTLTMDSFKQGVKDLFIGILEDVTTSFTDEFIIAPIKDFISSQFKSMMSGAFGGLFGGGQNQVVSLLQQQLGTQQNAAQLAQSSFNQLEKTFEQQMDIFEGLGMEVQRVQVVGGIGGIGSPVLVQDFADPTGSSLDLGKATAGLRQNTKGIGQSTQQTAKNTAAVSESTEAAVTNIDATKGVTAAADTAAFSFENLADFAGMAGAGLGALAGGLIGGPAGSAVGSIVGMIAGQGLKMLFSSMAGPSIGTIASGGLVHMASGGQMRDRVPAMLEPGEFVIRKPMAKAIGGPALSAMNAHGTMPNNPNVVVNMNNQGTPQESEGKPNVQVTPEAIIVDIVTRDMQNNGPIRRSIRGNLS